MFSKLDLDKEKTKQWSSIKKPVVFKEVDKQWAMMIKPVVIKNKF